MDETTVARYIKEIGRGKNAARDLSRDDARSLFTIACGQWLCLHGNGKGHPLAGVGCP